MRRNGFQSTRISRTRGALAYYFCPTLLLQEKRGTIPQKHCRFLIADCRLVSNARSQLEIGNWQSKMRVVAVEGIEPTSLDYQSSALAFELHREVVDPTGLKPAPHGLKGRCSVTRAPGQ